MNVTVNNAFMNQIEVDNFSFSYPGTDLKAVDSVSFKIDQGSFLVVAGPSGSGKTTLLRCLKPELAPFGEANGTINWMGTKLDEMSSLQSVHDIAFVMQNPANQIVMDVVWHELAFGLENMGLPADVIERRIAETAHFFGIAHWIHRKISELSGGEKQILNLASSLILQPRTLILDEPTAQLDPIAIKHFLNMLQRIHQEIGTTIILSEHRMADVLPMASDVLFLENGRVSFHGSPRAFGHYLLNHDAPFKLSLPVATRIPWELRKLLIGNNKKEKDQVGDELALSIDEARSQVVEILGENQRRDIDLSDRSHPVGEVKSSSIKTTEKNVKATGVDYPILTGDRLWFRYKSELPFVLEETSLKIRKGTIHALVGGNGSGKSTLLYLLAGVLKPQRGSIKRSSQTKLSLLTQNPQAIYSCDTLLDDLLEHQKLGHYDENDVLEMSDRLGIRSLLKRHPYDLSGGEMQKGALAKILLLRPHVLLLDEPVKGLDAVSKSAIADIFRDLHHHGTTILLVTHDLEFSAEIADECSLIFDGRIVASGETKPFFTGNAFYTTEAYRVTRQIMMPMVTMQDFDVIERHEKGY